MAPAIRLVGEPKDEADAYVASGIVFAVIYGCMFIVVVWRAVRSYLHYRAIKVYERRKLLVHASLAVFALLDFLYGISLIIEKSERYWGVSIHVLAMLSSTVAYWMMPLIWSRVLEFGGTYRVVQAYIGTCLVLCVLSSVVYFAVQLYAKDEDTNLVDEVTLAHVFIATATMLPLSIWLFIYASKVHYGLSMYQTRQNAETRASRMRAIRRVLVVAMVFSLCYFMRGACVLMYAIDFFSGYSPTKHFSIMGWYLCSQWIPFVIPSTLMLYVAAPSSAKRLLHRDNLRLKLVQAASSPSSSGSTSGEDNNLRTVLQARSTLGYSGGSTTSGSDGASLVRINASDYSSNYVNSQAENNDNDSIRESFTLNPTAAAAEASEANADDLVPLHRMPPSVLRNMDPVFYPVVSEHASRDDGSSSRSSRSSSVNGSESESVTGWSKHLRV